MSRPDFRDQTRAERYSSKQKNSVVLPLSLACINIEVEENVGFMARTVACFGLKHLHIVGKVPSYDALRRYSAGTCNFVNIKNYSNPTDLVRYAKENGIYLVSMELTDNSQSIEDFILPNQETIVVVGSERLGVPTEILHRSDAIVYIPLLGAGYSLNTSQCANIVAYDFSSRIIRSEL